MIEVPVDFVKPGDALGKHHSFKRFEGGMSSTVNLMKGYVLTRKVLEKLKTEYNVESLCIAEKSDDLKNIKYQEAFDEIERQKIVDTFIENMNKIKTSMIIDMEAIGSIVTDILNSVFRFIKNGKGNFRTISKAFSELQSQDMYTWNHSINTAIYAAVIALTIPDLFGAEQTKYTDTRFNKHEVLVFNMLFHDLGKVRIPAKILNKTESLTEQEMEIVRTHPYSGFAHIRKINEALQKEGMPLIPAYFGRACLLHHQAYDGSGYPSLRKNPDEIRPFKGEEIPLVARIAAVADIYDAVTSIRPHRLPFHPAEAQNILIQEKGRKLDPGIVDAFVETLSPFPLGTTVMLSTNDLAAVTGYINGNKLYPEVRPFMRKTHDKKGKERIIRLPPYRDTVKITASSKIKIVINKDIYQIAEGRETYPV